jgi:hypothetical protein
MASVDASLSEPPPHVFGSSAAPASLRPLPPASDNLTARLAVPLAAIKMPKTPLRVMLETIGALGAVKIKCDTAALARAGLNMDDAAAVQLNSASLADVLRQALQIRGLAFVATGDDVIVTLPPVQEAPLKAVTYAVEDLAGDNAALEQLAILIRAVVLPRSWESRGGGATLSVADGALVVQQSAEGHWQLLLLCEKLRQARGLPTRSVRAAASVAPDARRQLAAAMQRPVSLHAADGVPLAEVVRLLAARGRVNIDIDDLALARAGINSRVPTKIHMDNAPLETTLQHALKPLGLTWQPLGPSAVTITTSETLMARDTVEVYPIGRLIAHAKAGHGLARRLTREVAPETWAAEGGTGNVLFDPASRALIVCQPYPVQAQVEAALATWGVQ